MLDDKAVRAKKIDERSAKGVLEKWPRRSDTLWDTPKSGGYWLRVQPPTDSKRKQATLHAKGAAQLPGQPAGLWAFFLPEEEAVEIVALEVCATIEDCLEKRPIYHPENGGFRLLCPKTWLCGDLTVQAGAVKERWDAAGTFEAPPSDDHGYDVRFHTVLYFLPDDAFTRQRRTLIPLPHEYFSRHSSMATQSAKNMQDFVRRMTAQARFYPNIR